MIDAQTLDRLAAALSGPHANGAPFDPPGSRDGRARQEPRLALRVERGAPRQAQLARTTYPNVGRHPQHLASGQVPKAGRSHQGGDAVNPKFKFGLLIISGMLVGSFLYYLLTV